MKRRLAIAALALVGVAIAAPVARADDSGGAGGGPGDGFQSVSLSAVAGGQRILADTIAGQSPGTVDTGIPDAEASMTTSSGHALASVVWPSALAANAGSLLFLLGPNPCTPALPNLFPGQPQLPPECSPVPIPPDVMAQYHYLNSPVRAEAVYPVTPAANESVPGATMTSRANGIETAADAIIGASVISDIGKAETARATTNVRFTGPTGAVADAISSITGINIAGEIKIGSITSIAHGETDGNNAMSSGATTVNDMTIHGIPVTVDDKGVHVNGQTADAVGPATDVVNQALAGFGGKVYVTRPTQKLTNGVASFDAGSLIIDVFPPGAPGGVVFEFGGAHITAGATLPFQLDAGATEVGGIGAVGGGGGDAGALPPLSATGANVSTPLAPGPTVADVPIQAGNASEATKLPGGISAWWVFAGIVATIAAAAALRRLPEEMLTATGPQCSTGEDR